jgi:hypothetical protein
VSDHTEDLRKVQARKWFYEFELPNGAKTTSDIPEEVRHIHRSRIEKLREVISMYVEGSERSSALDLASHEGFFSIELSKHFASVQGLEIRPESLEAARLITRALGISNVTYENADLTKIEIDDRWKSDFVLVYGLLYHLENPVQVIRLASQLARKHILIETQIFPYDISGRLEDGNYRWQREVQGVFSLSVDYAARREGGSTDIALVPSLNALVFLLKNFGFNRIEVLPSADDDYEQFRRGARVVVYGQK